ncbi:iron chelate uptake ABC transporter family permease subunit [Microtetraspora sp. AC03309]|uniref:iron chelate uptake ABC transporter family permease subunit n=1 Tax=Microtetraspora sp. AC03309 TaxID=2779376 RepID=UPI001E4FC7AC|nr:iron chelate uptake ABC transporter family permease subunit [Microtetraspora sp. AC03309]MCC5578409.1 iron chelate uptake ABC transporter family permease subunit [Microtetraspora sp. AC03309]
MMKKRAVGLVLSLLALGAAVMASLAVGAQSIPFDEVWRALWHGGGSEHAVVVRELRLPRTLLGLGVGAALGLAGALVQALTRNPLGDPGLLGVNAGASAAVVVAIAFLGITTPLSYVWFAFAGALGAAVAVYALGSRGRGGATPVRLALAGTAVGAALQALVSGIVMVDLNAFDKFRFWAVGSLSGRDLNVLAELLPFLAVGIVLALALARPLNSMALGDDVARALGVRLTRTRVLGAVAVVLLCGSATASVGPLMFVGLAVPHLARAVTGPDQRWLMPYSVVLAAVLLLAADVVARLVAWPGELEVGLVTAFLGAPVLIALVRGVRMASL